MMHINCRCYISTLSDLFISYERLPIYPFPLEDPYDDAVAWTLVRILL